MSSPFPEPWLPASSRADVFLRYLEYFRSRIVSKLGSMTDSQLRRSRLPSGWTPLELLHHLAYDELRWLEWRFEGRDVADPWADERDGRLYVDPARTLPELVEALQIQAERSRAIIEAHDLADVGRPGDGWAAGRPAELERVLLHLLQEYARHLGHLDIVAELAGGEIGE
jgi:Protein of unknown function (DUF664)